MHVRICNHAVYTHTAFTLGALFCKDVTFESFLKGDLTCTGNFEALLCAAVGFYLWHYITCLSYSLLALPIGRKTYGALWEMFKSE